MTFPDGLRAVASLIVVLPHAVGLLVVSKQQNRFDTLTVLIAKHGTIGVSIFFVLSGFVIAFSIGRQFITARYLGIFILRRSVRLDPPYWCAIALSVAFILFRAHVSPGHVIIPSVSNIVAHLFYLQNILRTPEINVVFWTLCLEVQLYIAFCALLALSQRLHLWLDVQVEIPLTVTYVVSLLWPMHVLRGSEAWFPVFWFSFISGVLVYWATERRIRWSVAALLIAPILLIGIFTGDLRTVTAAVTALALLLCGYRQRLYRWLAWSPLQWIGKLSYCLYLVHVPIVGVLLAMLTRFHPASTLIGYVAVVAVYIISIASALLMHRIVEVPALRWSQRLKSLLKPRPEAITMSV